MCWGRGVPLASEVVEQICEMLGFVGKSRNVVLFQLRRHHVYFGYDILKHLSPASLVQITNMLTKVTDCVIPFSANSQGLPHPFLSKFDLVPPTIQLVTP